jgi:PAS domain S-box-containing protein
MLSPNHDQCTVLQAKIAELEQQLYQCQMQLRQSQGKQYAVEPVFQKILEQVPIAIAHIRIFRDHRFEYIYCSQGHEAVFGYSPEEFTTSPTLWLSRVDSADQETAIFYPGFEGHLAEQTSTVEYRFCCKDGSLRWISSTFSCKRDDTANCWIATGASTDITHHKQAEIALRQSEEKFRQVAENIHEVFFVESANSNQVLYVSPAFEKIWQVPCETLYRQPNAWLEAIHPNDRELVLSDLAQRSQGEYVEREFRIVRPNGEIRWLFSRCSPVFNEARHLIHYVGIAEDITDRKQAEQKIQFQASLLNQVRNAVICTDLEGNITYWNRFAETLYQWTAAETLGQRLLDLIVPSEQESIVSAEFEQLRQIHHSEGERLLKRKDGTLLTVLFATTATRDELGSVTGLVSVSMDISERKRAEEALREREQQLATLTANIPGGIYQGIYDPAGNLLQLYLNEGYRELLGYEPQELMSYPEGALTLIHPEDREQFYQAVASARETLEPNYLEYRLITASGDVKWIRDHARFSWDENGNFIVNGIDIDISDRKQIEAALTQSEVQYRLLFENNPNPMWIFDASTLAFLAVNDAAVWKYGYSKAEFLAMTIADIRLPEDVPTLMNTLSQERCDCYTGEWRHRKRNGEIFDVEISSHIITWEDKEARFIAAKDISDRKQAERALQQLNQELEQRIHERTQELERSQAILWERKRSFKTLVENTPDIIARFDRELRHLYINPVIEQIIGIPANQCIGKTKQELGLPDNLIAEWFKHLQHVFDNGLPCKFEFDLPSPSGLQHYQSKLVPEFAPDGAITSVLAISRDITSFKHAQDALYQSEQLFRAVFENAAVGIAVAFPPDFKLMRTNRVLQQMLGYSAEELAALDYSDITHPDDRAVEVLFKRQVSDQQSYFVEKRLICKNGQVLWVIVSISLLWDANNQMQFGIGMVQDITSRKQAEEQLRQSETLLRDAQQIARLGSWEFDVTTQKTTWSEEKFHIFGLDSGQPEPTYEQFLEHYIHPDDRDSLRLAVTRAIAQVEPYTLDLRFIQPDKTLGYLLVKGQPILNDQGQVVKLLGIVMDISDLKGVEIALRESEERYRRLFTSIDEGFCVVEVLFDADGKPFDHRILHANPAFERLSGVPNPEGKTASELVPGIEQSWNDLYAHVLNTGEPIRTEQRSDALERWFNVLVSRIDDVAQHRVAVVFTDISDRKMAEITLQQKMQREQLLRVITQRIRQSLNLSAILETAVSEVRQLFQADRALIFRLLPHGQGYIIKETVLPQFPSLGVEVWIDNCLTPDSIKYYCVGQPRIVSDVALDEWGACLGKLLNQIGVRSKISAPIIQTAADGSTQVWGLLIVHACTHHRLWQPDEAGFLQQISNQLAIAIQQSDLYQRAQSELIERQQAEARLRASLQEKEVLLKEVHHRVKNNMQMVSSLLNLQADSIQDPEILQPFIDSQRRIKTMALIHEKLYQSHNLAQLNFADYVQELADELLQSFKAASFHIHLIVEVVDISLTVDTAIPCGLIINELVINALKYAFPETKTGEIRIQFIPDPTHPSPDHQYYILSVSDNGVGIPEHIDFCNTESLGLQIVYILTGKLEGTISLTRTNGTKFSILIPLANKIYKLN